MKQLEFNFETSRQLEIPFTQWISENQEQLEQAKADIKNPKLSEAQRRDAKALLETLKQTQVRPQQ
jgi:hypothetical protein